MTFLGVISLPPCFSLSSLSFLNRKYNFKKLFQKLPTTSLYFLWDTHVGSFFRGEGRWVNKGYIYACVFSNVPVYEWGRKVDRWQRCKQKQRQRRRIDWQGDVTIKFTWTNGCRLKLAVGIVTAHLWESIMEHNTWLFKEWIFQNN